jgi:hypothetical protein
MKTLFKSVLAVATALFLSISLSSCSEDGAKNASQSSTDNSSVFGSVFTSGSANSVKKFSGDQNWAIVMKGGFSANDPDLMKFLNDLLSDPEKRGVVSSVGNGFVSVSFKWKGGGVFEIPSGLKEKVDTYTLKAGSAETLWALRNGVVEGGRA